MIDKQDLNKELAKANLKLQSKKKAFSENNSHPWQEEYLHPGPEFEEHEFNLRDTELDTKLLAYYLPQFHPFKENNEWWGNGFTEWTNATSARSRFKGHHQPHLPRDLGYYDLRSIDTMYQQADLAKKSGIFGWCFYYYRFGDKRIMELPTDQFLSEEKLDMPFCLMWANENWARTWDGKSGEILIRQNYDPKHDDFMIDDLARHFNDPRYIRINNKPLYFIYCPKLIPDAKRRIEHWRNLLVKRHNIEATFYMALTYDDPSPLDGAIEFPPHNHFKQMPRVTNTLKELDPNFKGQMVDYDDLIKLNLLRETPDFNLIKCLIPSWDNEARKTNRGFGHINCSPDKYQIWLEQAIHFAKENPIENESFVCINAWNEWAEGAHLEPDVYYGSAYLNATARALINTQKA